MNFKLRNLVASTLASTFLLGFASAAIADSTDDIVNALMAKGVLTEEEGALLLKGRSGEKEASDKKKESAVSAKFKDGLSFESGDGKFKAQINGRVHTDYRNFDHDDGAGDRAEARRFCPHLWRRAPLSEPPGAGRFAVSARAKAAAGDAH